jgi:hypothetical protein
MERRSCLHSAQEGVLMRRLCILLCALFFFAGCASDGEKGSWDEFWKDLRGDNMKMRNNFSGVMK